MPFSCSYSAMRNLWRAIVVHLCQGLGQTESGEGRWKKHALKHLHYSAKWFQMLCKYQSMWKFDEVFRYFINVAKLPLKSLTKALLWEVFGPFQVLVHSQVFFSWKQHHMVPPKIIQDHHLQLWMARKSIQHYPTIPNFWCSYLFLAFWERWWSPSPLALVVGEPRFMEVSWSPRIQ